jgi:hypothetical protein
MFLTEQNHSNQSIVLYSKGTALTTPPRHPKNGPAPNLKTGGRKLKCKKHKLRLRGPLVQNLPKIAFSTLSEKLEGNLI